MDERNKICRERLLFDLKIKREREREREEKRLKRLKREVGVFK